MEPLKTNINCNNSVSSQPSDFTTSFFDEESVSMTASEFNIVQNMQKSQNEMNLTQIQQSRMIMTVLGNFEELQRNFKQLQINYNSLQQKFEKSQEVNEKSIKEIQDRADNQNDKITKIARDALQIAKEAKDFVDDVPKKLETLNELIGGLKINEQETSTQLFKAQETIKDLQNNQTQMYQKLQQIDSLEQKLQNGHNAIMDLNNRFNTHLSKYNTHTHSKDGHNYDTGKPNNY